MSHLSYKEYLNRLFVMFSTGLIIGMLITILVVLDARYDAKNVLDSVCEVLR